MRVQSGIADTRQQVKDANGDITEGKKSSLMAHSSSHTSGNSPSATPTGQLTPRERRALAHTHSSCSSLSRGHGSKGSSPQASSWESFSRGVTLREKQQGRRQERVEHGERMGRRHERKEDREQEDGETHTAVAEAPLLKAEEDEGAQGLMKHSSGRKKVRWSAECIHTYSDIYMYTQIMYIYIHAHLQVCSFSQLFYHLFLSSLPLPSDQ